MGNWQLRLRSRLYMLKANSAELAEIYFFVASGKKNRILSAHPMRPMRGGIYGEVLVAAASRRYSTDAVVHYPVCDRVDARAIDELGCQGRHLMDVAAAHANEGN